MINVSPSLLQVLMDQDCVVLLSMPAPPTTLRGSSHASCSMCLAECSPKGMLVISHWFRFSVTHCAELGKLILVRVSFLTCKIEINSIELGFVVHVCDSSTQEVEAGRS
jgi:hypothetical protein